MPRSTTARDVSRQRFGRSYSSEDITLEPTDSPPVSPVVSSMSGEGHGGSTGGPSSTREGPRLSVVVLSALGSAAAVAAVGCFCALIYPILRELRAARVRDQDGTELRMLGFWSILVLSVFVGCICCVFSWTLTYLDSHQPAMVLPTLTLAHFRDVSGHGFHMRYGVAVLNGIMAMLTVIWTLT
ncbi:ADP-ribosylation factor-like protein 6-interacting protein 6 [Chelmon rostratus]|uniref:ADP-ribosylation factor-like protein 6-interacting protein 6 n=1 Tax=Chelmon rostratus TaxID=109905 RepID=UPI001BE93A17|nr:ADP-ribosylation factor-like protein 6-interacting protein 6 [Chelmon rostratus]